MSLLRSQSCVKQCNVNIKEHCDLVVTMLFFVVYAIYPKQNIDLYVRDKLVLRQYICGLVTTATATAASAAATVAETTATAVTATTVATAAAGDT